MANWRFRVTDMHGNPVDAQSIPMFQEIRFLIGYGRRDTESRAQSIIDWICRQPPPRTVIAESAPATAKLQVSNKKHRPWATMVRMPDPHHRPLVDGWVNVRFCVGKNGHVENVTVKSAAPHGLYKHAAVAALESWKFTGRRSAGSRHARTCGLSYHIRVIGEASLARSPSVIDQRPTAMRADDLALPGATRPDHGRVNLRFCIGKQGKVKNPRIVASTPGGVFDRAAIRILRLWSYWPRTVDGTPVTTCGVEESVVFKVGHDKLVWAYPGTS